MSHDNLGPSSSPLLLATLFACFALGACCDDDSSGGLLNNPAVAPVASYSANPTSGPRPLDVSFQNDSTGVITSYLWDFGDGSTSSEESPLHQYTTTGHFNVSLQVSGPGGANERLILDLIQVTSPFQDPSFEIQTAGSAPVAPWPAFYGPGGAQGHVIHSAAGGGDLGMPTDALLWCQIGAESTSNALPPTDGVAASGGAGIRKEFTYPPGQSVLLFDALFINAEAQNQSTNNDWVDISVSDGANSISIYRRDTFSAVEGTSSIHAGQLATPHEVVTAKLDSLFPQSDFTTLLTLTMQVGNGGDGNRPSHAYVDAGVFQPAGAPLAVDFSADQTSVQFGLPIQFTDLTPGNPTSWVWDFGDGLASTLQHPVHTYAQAGIYDVRLRATAPGTTGELLKDDYITVFAPAGVLDFRAQTRKVKTGHDANFVNISSGPFISWDWSFGDGQGTSQTSQPAVVPHAYSTPGFYSVGLSGTFLNGSGTSILKTDFIVVQDPPVITSLPFNHSVNFPQSATFTVTATGTALSYEWRRNGQVIAGAANSPVYVTPPSTAAMEGDFYTCRVFNLVGSATSQPEFLHVVL